MKYLKIYEDYKFDNWELKDLEEYVDTLKDKISDLYHDNRLYHIAWKLNNVLTDELQKIENEIRERNKSQNEWIIPLKKPDFYIALRKLGIEGSELRGWENRRDLDTFFHGQYSKPLPNAKYIVMRKHEKGGFTWSSYDDRKEDYEEDIDDLMMNITKKEVEDYELLKAATEEAEKYNM